MNHLNYLILRALPYILLTFISIFSSEIEGKIEKGLCDKSPDVDCDRFFCECKPLLRGNLSSMVFTLAADAPPTTFPPVPIDNSIGYGKGITLSNSPLFNNFGMMIAPSNRVDICRCGWYRIGLYGTIFYDGNAHVDVTLVSSLLGGNIKIATLDPNTKMGPYYSVGKTDFKHFSDINSCNLVYYTVVFSSTDDNISESSSSIYFVPGANNLVLFQRMGPCENCPHEEPCCCSKKPCNGCKK